MNVSPAAQLVADAVIEQPMAARAAFLREVLAYATAGLVVIEGKRAASETLDLVNQRMIEAGS